MDLGWPEIVLILVIVMVVFGVGKLPQVGEALGKSIREFKRAQRDDDDSTRKVPAVETVQQNHAEVLTKQ
jgi:sec-independent protein translocase protein TatA